jgi:hypothetical protein
MRRKAMLLAFDVDGPLLSEENTLTFGAVAEIRLAAENPYDRLLYITRKSKQGVLSRLVSAGFPQAESLIQCKSDADKLQSAILACSAAERIMFVGTRSVLETTDMNRIFRNYPQEVASLSSRLVFVLYGYKKIPVELLRLVEFPIEPRFSWKV